MNTEKFVNTVTPDSSNKTALPAVALVRWQGDHSQARQEALRQALQDHPQAALLLVHAAVPLPEHLLKRWQQHLLQTDESVDGITVLSNAEERFNPFQDHPEPPQVEQRQRLHTLVSALADGSLCPVPAFPQDRLLLRAEAAQRLAARPQWPQAQDPQLYGFQIELADDIYLDDPRHALFQARPEQRWQAAPSESFARLSTELRRLIDDDIQQLDRPQASALLHVTHSWGGGVNRWLLDWCRHDTNHHHYILRSQGDWQRARYGCQLALYVYDHTRQEAVLLREFQLTPAITATRVAHPQYQQVLNWIVQRFAVQRLLVSSIIGHSLEALRTGLPCIYALHDFYPSWPLLSVNPLPYRHEDTQSEKVSYALAQAIAQHPQREFNEAEIEQWQQLSKVWVEHCLNNEVKLAAPTHSAAGIISELNPALKDKIQVISHGLPEWREPAAPVPAKTRNDRRLRLVIPGRFSPHKGLNLLRKALPKLKDIAHITLLGCDRNGFHLLGESGIDIIPNYEQQQLPQLMAQLQPDAALLLSIVPETFSYTLSEMWSLGVVPIATELGSFAERISDYEDGILVPPDAESLVRTLQQLYDEPEILSEIKRQVLQLNDHSMAAMLEQYEALWPQAQDIPSQAVPALALSSDVAELKRSAMWLEDERKALKEVCDSLVEQLQNRTHWAQQNHAQAQRLRENLQNSREAFQEQITLHKEWLKQREQAVEKHRHQRDELSQQLDQVRTRLHFKHQQFEQVLEQKQRLDKELQQEHEQLALVRQQLSQQLQTERERVHQQAQQLIEQESQIQQLRQVEHEHQQVLASRSWRITKPLRVFVRTARNAKRARVHLPWRWPWIIKRLLQLMFSQGLGGTIRRLQQEPSDAVHNPDEQHSPQAVQNSLAELNQSGSQDSDAANPADGDSEAQNHTHTDSPPPVVKPEAVQLQQSAQPQVGVCVLLGEQALLLSAQLKQLAQLQEQYDLVTVACGNAHDDIANYLEQCQGLLTIAANSDTEHDPLAAGEHCLSQAIKALGDADIPVPDHWLILDANSEPQDQALQLMLQALEQQEPHAVVSASLIDKDNQVRVLCASGERLLPADHPQHAFGRTLSDDESYPAAISLSRMGVSPKQRYEADSAAIGARYHQHRQEHPCYLQPFARHLWQQNAAALPVVNALSTEHESATPPSILIIDAWVPTPDQDSGSLRMVQLLQVARSLGWHVVFCSADRSHRGRYTSELQMAGIEVWHGPYLKDFQTFLSHHGQRFQAVMLSRYYVAQELLSLVQRHCPKAITLFDTVDLHFLREEREAELKDSATLKRLAAATRKQELALMEQSSTTVVVSPVEQKLLNEICPEVDVAVLSNIHHVSGSGKPFEERKDIIFIGGFQHPPNVDAMKWFISAIWPRIHTALPEVRFKIIGSKMPDEIKNLDAPNVDILGFVPDIEPYLEGCRLSVAPLRYGAGVKGKVNSSMSHGQPVVATTIAVEGMEMQDGEEVLVADDTLEYADAVIRLYQDQALWERLAEAGLANIEAHFSFTAAQQQLRHILNITDDENEIISEPEVSKQS